MPDYVVRPISVVTIDSSGTATSDMFRSNYGSLRGMYFSISTATSGPFVTGSIRYLTCADTATEFLLPLDTAGAANFLLYGLVNSLNRYISFRPGDVPYAPWAQVRLISRTDDTITFDSVYLVYHEELKR